MVESDFGYRLLVGRDIYDLVQAQEKIKTASLLGIAAIVVLGLVGGFIMSRWMLARLEGINRSTSRIMAGEFGRRIGAHGNGDEFDNLAENLNAMLDRIERLLDGMRQVTENVAHDLRTPLTRSVRASRRADRHSGDPDESASLLEQTLQDADRLIETFNALLEHRAGGGRARSRAIGSGWTCPRWRPTSSSSTAAGGGTLHPPRPRPAGRGGSSFCHRQLVVPGDGQRRRQCHQVPPPGGRVSVVTARDLGPDRGRHR